MSARPLWEDVRAPLQRYAELLLDWNRSVNLTGARTVEQVEAQVKDAAALLAVSWKGIRRVIDIGSGGGLPAVPLALALAQGQVTLLEAHARKRAFLGHVPAPLQLRNAALLCGRAGDPGPPPLG